MIHRIVGAFLLLMPLNPLLAQFVSIPDPLFKGYLEYTFPTCFVNGQMDTTCSQITSRTFLEVQNRGIADLTGVQYFDNLSLLKASGNNLSALPPLPPTIERVHLSDNNLTSAALPTFPASLLLLDLQGNPLGSAPNLPPNLEALYLANTGMGAWASPPIYPPSVEVLSINGNQLTAFPTNLPPNLKSGQFSFNPNIGPILSFPTTLTDLGVANCNQTSLPPFPPNLSSVRIDGNPNLDSIPSLPASLLGLNADDCNLSELGPLPPNLRLLEIDNNPITCLPELPPTLTLISADNIPVTCVPAYLPVMPANLLAKPICQSNDPINNPNGCLTQAGISGIVYTDINNDCNYSSSDFELAGIPVRAYSGANLVAITSTASNGSYSLLLTPGTYRIEVDTSTAPVTAQCPGGVDSVVTISTGSPYVADVNFALECDPGFDLAISSIYRSGIVFPGQPFQLNVEVGELSQSLGLNCASGIAGTIDVSVSGPVTYTGSSGISTPVIAGNLYTYTVSDFLFWDFYDAIALDFVVDTSAQIGDSVCVQVNIQTTASGDIDPTNNSRSICIPVVNSYDPNLKEVFPAAAPANFNDYLTYTIYFQNTGTAPAYNVKLVDTLSADLDWKSFQWLGASHPATFGLYQNVLTFKMPNIILPDSASDPEGSQGYAQFRIRPNAPMPDGSSISNRVAIFFDFNAPVITPDVIAVFGDQTVEIDPVAANSLHVFPNPGSGVFQLRSGGKLLKGQLSIFDIRGQVVHREILPPVTDATVDLQDVPAGMYLVRLVDAERIFHAKLIIR